VEDVLDQIVAGGHDHLAQIIDEQGHSGKLLRIAGELARQDTEELVHHRARDQHAVLLSDGSPQCFIGASSRQEESRHVHIGVEDDPHSRR
jgi:hypothetical protein